MRIVIDMNLSPSWVDGLAAEGIEALHWSTVGDPRASDVVIMTWAREHGCVVFTHDLDFGALLAATEQLGPSVIQVRTQDVTPARLASTVSRVLRTYTEALEAGALITIDDARSRVRILPLQRNG